MTAVEWLVEQLNSKYNNDDFIITHINEIEKAKEMEKQQQDNFAIGFAEWLLKFDNLKNENIYVIQQLLEIYKEPKEPKELLEIYKKEKTL